MMHIYLDEFRITGSGLVRGRTCHPPRAFAFYLHLAGLVGSQPSILSLMLARARSASRSFCLSTKTSASLPSTGMGMV